METIKTVTDINAIIINGEYYAVMDDGKYGETCSKCDLMSECKNMMRYCSWLGICCYFKRIGSVNVDKLQGAIEV